MAKRVAKKRVKVSKFERLIYTFAIVLAVSSPMIIVFSKATLAKINFEVEKQKKCYRQRKAEKKLLAEQRRVPHKVHSVEEHTQRTHKGENL